ncbi:hypothetical protein GGI25_000945 [Coemansia spiralis]|uniref:Zn(2)-C6 fungal-type domain-containing protein n=2 Tax=Coemansia TaxID=4863 RepID=A0A9W8G6Z8_9FUNG|nr:hypothetical protein EDC05_001964 [Coemansia umbellata]KAJ2680057.1 hypothetical protein GGI25_000945 [Coemansia spiralis]
MPGVFNLQPQIGLPANTVYRQNPWFRPRRTRACQNCHIKKLKCEGDRPKCRNCTRIKVECKWLPMKKRGPKPKNDITKTVIAVSEEDPNINLPITTEARARKESGVDIITDSKTSESNRQDSPASTSRFNNIFKHAATPNSFTAIPMDTCVEPFSDEPQEEILRRFYSDEVCEDTRDTVIYYFDYFYGICPVFHPALFLRRVVEGRVEQLLLDAMRASAARVIMQKTGKSIDMEKLISHIYERILVSIDNPTLDFVRTVLLMASINGGEGNFMMYNSLTYLAASLVTRLGWHMLDLEDSSKYASTWEEWVLMEVKRRIFWTTYQIDSYQSLLMDRPMSISATRVYVLSPGSDNSWEDITVSRSTNWPRQFDPFKSKENILKNASSIYSFVDLCNFTAVIYRVGKFLWDFKVSLKAMLPSNGQAPNIKYFDRSMVLPIHIRGPVKSLFEFAEFRELHHSVCRWRSELIRAEELKNGSAASYKFSEFGSYKHRLHIMRIRYFCLYGYSLPVLHMLHMANRPSFFSVSANKAPSQQSADSIEDNVIRELMAGVFSSVVNDGFLAYDVVQESWDTCLDAVYEYVSFLDKNSDIPLDRYDQVMPFGLFTSITVLIRQTRLCKQKIGLDGTSKDKGSHSVRYLREELLKSIRALRRLWSLLLDLGVVWKVKSMEYLLRTMQVEEMTNAADLLSELAL